MRENSRVGLVAGPPGRNLAVGGLLQRAAAAFDERRIPIDHVHGLAYSLVGRDAARPRGEGRGAGAAFEDRAFEVTERGVVARGRAAVVAGEDDERVIQAAGLLERRFDLADGFVDRGEHPGEFLAVALQVGVGLEVAVRDLEGAVDAVEGYVEKERLGGIA